MLGCAVNTDTSMSKLIFAAVLVCAALKFTLGKYVGSSDASFSIANKSACACKTFSWH